MTLTVQIDEAGLIIVKSIVDGEPVAEIIIEEAGDAVRKVIHVQEDHDDSAKVVFHA